MPTYEYACGACGRRFEKFQPMSHPPVDRCPACGGEARRLLSGGLGAIVKKPEGGCSLQGTGRTCCGREERCGQPSCGEGGG